MRTLSLKEYLFSRAMGDSSNEMKQLEWIFIAVRWLWVPTIFVLEWLHEPVSDVAMVVIGAVLGAMNIFAGIFNYKIIDLNLQRIFGIVSLVIDTLAAWAVIFLFAYDFYTAAYAGFVYIIIEAAIRFGLIGSLSMAVIFVLGLLGAYSFREIEYGVRFSNSGFIYWTAIMLIVAVAAGTVVNEWKRQRNLSEQYLKESIILSFAPLLSSYTQAQLSPAGGASMKSLEPLTKRENEVLGLIASGKSNYEISRMLNIEEKTVKNYINNIYSKLQIKNSYEAISLMLRSK